MADRFNRLFLRTLRALRDLRRYAPPVTIQNLGSQVNVAAQQVVADRSSERSWDMNWPAFEPVTFFNMVIQTAVGFVAGLIGVWAGVALATKHARKSQKEPEFRCWRDRLEELGPSTCRQVG